MVIEDFDSGKVDLKFYGEFGMFQNVPRVGASLKRQPISGPFLLWRVPEDLPREDAGEPEVNTLIPSLR